MYNINRIGENVASTEEYNVSSISSGYIASGLTLVGTMYYSFDTNGKQFRKKYVDASGNEQKYVFEYQDEQNVAVQLPTGAVSHAKSDHLGRKVFDELQLGKGFMNRKFTYHEGVATAAHINNDKIVSNPETTLVKQIAFADGRTIQYEYDKEERITKVIDSVDGTYEYTYDALGQLLTEKKNGTTVNTMTYDGYGNIKTKNGITYSYNSAWKDKLVSYNGQSITYDVNGNPTTYLGKTLVWEKGRQLKSYGSYTYKYNNEGIRISKTISGVEHKYVLDGTNIVKETWGSNTLIPLYDLDGTVCGIKYNGTAYYFYKNLQDDIIAITNSAGTVVARYTYDAWGKCTITSDTSGVSIATINPFRYRGYYYDTESGMYYLQSRYYDPAVGRFVNSDSPEMARIRAEGQCTIPNIFCYCYNDPINNNDETGYGCADALLNAVKTAFDIIVGIFDIAEAMEYTEADIKKIRKSTKKSRRQIEREIADAKKASKKWAKGFKIAGIFLSAISIILLICNYGSNATSVFRVATDCFVELFISLLIWCASKFVDLLLKLVPVPGVGFVLGFAAGYVIEALFSAWFNDQKKIRIQNSFYSSTISLLSAKSTDITKYLECFARSLGA